MSIFIVLENRRKGLLSVKTVCPGSNKPKNLKFVNIKYENYYDERQHNNLTIFFFFENTRTYWESLAPYVKIDEKRLLSTSVSIIQN